MAEPDGSDRAPADPETAEQHRLAEEAIIKEMKERDYRDRHRAQSPLQPAADATILDSTAMTLDQVLARAEEIVRSYLPTAPSS
jgi:cytidylate kinase